MSMASQLVISHRFKTSFCPPPTHTQVYVNWMDESLTQRDWVQSMDQWAQVLVHPEVQRIEEASLRVVVGEKHDE